MTSSIGPITMAETANCDQMGNMLSAGKRSSSDDVFAEALYDDPSLDALYDIDENRGDYDSDGEYSCSDKSNGYNRAPSLDEYSDIDIKVSADSDTQSDFHDTQEGAEDDDSWMEFMMRDAP
jgi:hypothetical protein